MKLFVAVVFYFVSAAVACTIQKIIPDPVKEIQFDSGNNINVISIRNWSSLISSPKDLPESVVRQIVRNSTQVMTKLDEEYKVVREIEKPGPVEESYFITNKNKNLHFAIIQPAAESSLNNESCTATIYKYNNENVSSTLYHNVICKGGKIFMDRDNIIYINTIDGVSLIKNDSDTPVLIENLQNYTFYHSIEDDLGNVFLGSDTVNSIFVIEKNSSKPSATRVAEQPDSPISKFVSIPDDVIAVYNKDGTKDAEMWVMSPKEMYQWRTWFYRANYYGHFISTEKGFFFTYTLNNWAKLALPAVFTKKSSEFPTSDLMGRSFDKGKELIAVDSRGTGHVYIATNTAELVHVSSRNDYDFRSPTVQKMPNNELIDALIVGPDDNIWILANHLYRRTRSSGSIDLISDLSFQGIGNSLPILEIKQGRLFIGADSGLYTCRL